MPTTEQLRKRLTDTLDELFQLNQPDLDFGFYRIMHAKAQQVTEFINRDLLDTIREAFEILDEAAAGKLREEYELALQTAREYGAADPDTAPNVKAARARLDACRHAAEAEAEIYEHLYRFFSRYYENGDFVSRRYHVRETDSQAAPYAVPYHGEEVKLHWANADQYYVKTTEHFNNFTFDLRKAKEVEAFHADDRLGLFARKDEPLTVHFRIVDATEGEHANLKASDNSKRYFIIHRERPIELNDNGELTINFRSPDMPAPKIVHQVGLTENFILRLEPG